MADYRDYEKEKRASFKKRKSSVRRLVRKEGSIPGDALEGIAKASVGNMYLVEEKASSDLYECYIAGRIISPNESSTVVTVGDYVHFVPGSEIGDETGLPVGTVVKVGERRTKISRRAPGNKPIEHVIAANVSRLMILMAAKTPKYNRRLIDRFLVAAEIGEAEPLICINKIDLVDTADLKQVFSVYEQLGIPVIYISATEGTGIDEVSAKLSGECALFAGPSGAGKSTLLNRLLGEEVQVVKEISEKTTKGRHTTSFIRMFDLGIDTRVVDSPGIREFGIWGIERDELPLYFHDFDGFHYECKFAPCTHIHEPGCAVKEAVRDGNIDAERYESYLNIYDSMPEPDEYYR